MKKLIAGNWKMNGKSADALSLAEGLKAGFTVSDKADMLVCPPFVHLSLVESVLKQSGIHCGAQDCSPHEKGAFTGDIACPMLTDQGCSYVIVGHSERRTCHDESNCDVKDKAAAALKAELIPIICVGESAKEREAGDEKTVIEKQLTESCPVVTDKQTIVVAYEPVWAIGSGQTATAEIIADMHDFIRSVLVAYCDQGVADITAILYGGSVKPENAGNILSISNVDGVLVGGASLDASSFLGIYSAAVE